MPGCFNGMSDFYSDKYDNKDNILNLVFHDWTSINWH